MYMKESGGKATRLMTLNVVCNKQCAWFCGRSSPGGMEPR